MFYRVIHMHLWNAIFISALGTLLHFTYDWSGQNPIVGAFSSVNESTWEHLKLLFFPMLISVILDGMFSKKRKSNYLCAKLKGILVSMLFTVTFFYTSKGVIGNNYAVLNILTFYVAVIIGEYVVWKSLQKATVCNNKKATVILVFLFICFIVFTYHTPALGIFQDPVTGKFGL